VNNTKLQCEQCRPIQWQHLFTWILSWYCKQSKISPVQDWQSTPHEWLSRTRDLDLDLRSGHMAYRRALSTPWLKLEMWANAQRDGRPAKQVVPSVQRRKVWLTLTTWLPCSNAAKMRKPLKFARVPQTGKQISAASGPKFTILRGYVEDILLLNTFFLIVDTCLICEDIARQICAMVPRWRFLVTFLRPVFSASRVQQVSELHLKFALRPHHVCKYGRHPICSSWD